MSPRALGDAVRFFDAFYPKVYRFVARLSGAPREDVDDLVQETLLIAWRQSADFEAASSLETWILAIAKNRVRRRYRAQARKKNVGGPALEGLESEALSEDVVRAEETGREVRSALGELEEHYVRVLVLRYVEGWSVARMAQELGESEKAVESRLTRAREGLRQKLKGHQNVGH